MQIDLLGSAVTALLVAGFGLLLIGVYPSKARENTLNLVKHGIFSTIATVVTLISVFVFMIPTFAKTISSTFFTSFSQLPVMWLHAGLGVAALVSAIVMIASWVKEPISELGCAKTFRLMKPALAIWAATIALGILMYFYV
ncbi:MAG TPA: hypothetical protein VMD05_05860 [Candidatus Nanoarchaeia archaeon]|nr:hypothetical protein [Candidatus Nanoarchaeia archaeon]